MKFNKRVLEEAGDNSVPLFERFKFVSIFHSNLDEFYMIRVGSLYDKSLLKDIGLNDNKTGWSPERQLKEIFRMTKELYPEADKMFLNVSRQLEAHGIKYCKFGELSKDEKKWLKSYFKREIMPLLSPQIIDTKHPFPHLFNKSVYIILELNYENKNSYGIISQNKNTDRIIEIPANLDIKDKKDGKGKKKSAAQDTQSAQEYKYILSEDVIYQYAKELFKKHKVSSKFIIRITRNADITVEESFSDYESYNANIDYRTYMNDILKRRGKLSPVRLEISKSPMNKFSRSKLNAMKKYLCAKLNILEEQAFITCVPLDQNFIFELKNKIDKTDNKILSDDMLYTPIHPVFPKEIDGNKSVMETVEKDKKDIFLSFPKHTIKAYLKLLEEAVFEPDVVSVKITLYRLSENSQIINYLCRLSEAGKHVTAVVELQARFDEENNINWSKRLEEAGCNVIYGVEGYKIHSKITLITKKSGNDITYITHLATGNYNEKTAKLYTDIGIITSDLQIGKDAMKFFNSITTSDPTDDYSCFLVAPFQFKSEIIKFIGEEIRKTESGKTGRIRLKMNSLTDKDIIEELVRASQSGVKIDLLIRGICCLLPGIPGKTDNIRVISIVGRFLEHSRIFIFGDNKNGGEPQVYMSSADLMTRNTTRRLEIAFPVFHEDIKAELERMFDCYWKDNVKSRELLPSGNYEKIEGTFTEYYDAQEDLFVM
ncbi:MAG: polyphosphate kinase 1 [Oscillospiraceae bacterium]|nr:polyphosphate kinase 1 [Oscillospiraceae bacterium]